MKKEQVLSVLAILLSATLFLGCGGAASTPAEVQTDSVTTNSADTLPSAPEMVEAKTFEAFLEHYPLMPLPYGRGKDDLQEFWVAAPSQHLSLETSNRFLKGSPGFERIDDTDRYACFERVELEGQFWVLLTYRMAYGDILMATVFDRSGKALDGMEVYSIPEEPIAIQKWFLFDADGRLNVFQETPRDMTGETDQGFVRDTTYYRVSETGKFVEE